MRKPNRTYNNLSGAFRRALRRKSPNLSGISHLSAPLIEAVAFINRIKAENRKARHNVYAYVLREGNVSRYSDDGEPQGTGGVPGA